MCSRSLITCMRIFCLVFATGCTLQRINTTAPSTPEEGSSNPYVKIVYPDNNAQIYEGISLIIEILAVDEDQGITRVDIYLNDQKYQEVRPNDSDTVPVFAAEVNWISEGYGIHQFRAEAYSVDDRLVAETTLIVRVLRR